jgi:hypothetical protein
LVAALSLFAATFFWLYIETQRDFRAVYEQNVELLDVWQANQLADAADSNAGQFGAAGPSDNRLRNLLPDLEWAANQFAAYEATEIPLGDQRLDLLDGLVKQLQSIGFSGVIEFDSHVGDFCSVRDMNGTFQSAPAEMPVADCDRVGLSPGDAQILSAKQSVAFANYIAALEGNSDQDIRVRLSTHGNSSPLVAYPARSGSPNAGEWNAIAQQNNRVRVRLLTAAEVSRPTADSL